MVAAMLYITVTQGPVETQHVSVDCGSWVIDDGGGTQQASLLTGPLLCNVGGGCYKAARVVL